VLESQKELFESRNARVVSINLDEPPRARAAKGFADQQGFTFPIVLNKTAGKAYDIDKAYQVKGTPTSYLIDSKGVIVEAHYGPLGPPELEASLNKLTAE
jgi:peroxiredoxin